MPNSKSFLNLYAVPSHTCNTYTLSVALCSKCSSKHYWLGCKRSEYCQSW